LRGRWKRFYVGFGGIGDEDRGTPSTTTTTTTTTTTWYEIRR
jgi:hypothetical protein